MHGLGFFALLRQEVSRLVRSIYQTPLGAPHRTVAAATPPGEIHLPEVTQFEDVFGEHNTKGIAPNSAPGEQRMQAREAPDEQAALTTNPGNPGSSGSAANAGLWSAARAKLMREQAAVAALVAPLGAPSDVEAPFGLPQPPAPPQLVPKPFRAASKDIGISAPSLDASTTQSAVTLNDSPATRPVEAAPATQPVNIARDFSPTTSPVTDPATTQPVILAANDPRPATEPVGQLPPASQPVAMRLPLTAIASAADVAHPVDAAPSTPGAASRGPAGDLGNRSESESDPFSAKPTITYRDGKVEARDGRKVKTVKPKLTNAAWLALSSMENPSLVLIAHVDEHGKVVGVDWERHSGSVDVDTPTYNALFEWEIEPSRDAKGNPRRDAIIIPFIWR